MCSVVSNQFDLSIVFFVSRGGLSSKKTLQSHSMNDDWLKETGSPNLHQSFIP